MITSFIRCLTFAVLFSELNIMAVRPSVRGNQKSECAGAWEREMFSAEVI